MLRTGWAAIVSLLLILVIFLGIVTQIIPVFSSIITNVSGNLQSASFKASEITVWFDKVNVWLIDRLPSMGRDFKLQDAVLGWIKNAFDLSSVTSVVGSVASALGSFGIGLFSVMFIGFFFVKDETLFRRIVGSLVPDKVEKTAISAIGDIEHLLTRYFVGLMVEVLGVALLNFLGLWLIARIGFYPAVGIAFMTGLLNVIPYVGPWIGGAIGTILGIVLKYSSAAAHRSLSRLYDGDNHTIGGLHLHPVGGQFPVPASDLLDQHQVQPSGDIHSAADGGASRRNHRNAGSLPAYTVLRVIAARFFSELKPIRRLIAPR